MIALPVFERLTVDDFALYPGTPNKPGLHAEFQPGLTLVIGANGLGKTTLVTLLYRLCSGPFDLESRGVSTLGGRSLEISQLKRLARRIFAARVPDDAASAVATLSFRLGQVRVEISRSLSDLRLTRLAINGSEVLSDEGEFQAIISAHSGLPAFGDWLLLLRHITFYFEDRRALVWDPTAQRQILRLLFLPQAQAIEWTTLERAILSKDSRMRNLQSVVGKEERELASADIAVEHGDVVRDELAVVLKLYETDQPKLVSLEDELAEFQSRRENARLEFLRAELANDAAYRDLERRQLLAITAAFPDGNETSAYVLAKLISENECLVCGQAAPVTAGRMRGRLSHHQCMICGAHLREGVDVKAFSPTSISRARTRLSKTAQALDIAAGERDASNAAHEQLLMDLQQLRARVAEHSSRIDRLVARLPPEEAQLHEQRGELSRLRSQVDEMKTDLADMRSAFRQFISSVNHHIVSQREKVEQTFARFAEGFLVESCELAWHPHSARVGESGEQIEYPAYELEMSGTGFESLVRRTGPEQVSESQREFIDLAFRMTLMSVATEGGVGSMVIDAPESSLDAVFVSRAAEVLSRFADPTTENRLITTSNVVEGNLIPELIRRAGIKSSHDARIVDLFTIAAPTAATKLLEKEYAEVRQALFATAPNGA